MLKRVYPLSSVNPKLKHHIKCFSVNSSICIMNSSVILVIPSAVLLTVEASSVCTKPDWPDYMQEYHYHAYDQ